MKVTEKQVVVMLDALRASLQFVNNGDNLYTFTYEVRKEAFQKVMNQTSEKLISVSDTSTELG